MRVTGSDEPAPRRPAGAVTGGLVGFVAAMLLAVLVIPDHDDATTSGSEALRAAGSPSGGGAVAVDGSTEPGEVTVAGEQPTSVGTPGETGVATPEGASGQQLGTAGAGRSGGGGAAAADNAKLPNGGATARGVTAKEVVVGVASVDPSALAPVCPACDPGNANSGAPVQALVEAWTRDGLLPVNGRTIKIVNRKVGLTADQQRSACTFFAQEVKPFMVVAGAGTSGVGLCLANEHKFPIVDPYGGYRETTIQQNYPLLHIVAPATPRILRNFVHWAEENGFLKGRKIAMVSLDDNANAATGVAFGAESPMSQAILTQNFRDVLARKGYRILVDAVLRDTRASDAPPHISRMKGEGVDVVFAFLNTGTKRFQQHARAQSFRPKYPAADTGYNFGEAGGADYYDADENEGAVGMAVRWWNWSRRSPATAGDNKPAQYCIDAYSAYTKKSYDTTTNSSELALTLGLCTGLEVTREAVKAAGPNLTVERFIAGLQTIKNLPTSEYPSVSFAPGKFAGSDFISTVQYRKARHQPSNNFWGFVAPWRPMYVP